MGFFQQRHGRGERRRARGGREKPARLPPQKMLRRQSKIEEEEGRPSPLAEEENKSKKERQNKSEKAGGGKSEKALSAVVIVLCIAGWIGLEVYQYDRYPKLSHFGLDAWSVKCKGKDRSYYLLSEIGADKLTVGSRHLKFLNESHETLYYSPRFEKEALDADGVWRFAYSPRDVRVFAKKDQKAVLKGDERLFEIAEDFNSMAVITAAGAKHVLNCQRLR